MKLTAKQLRQIISEEAGRLDEMFTPAGGIGFGDIPRPGRRSYLDLPIMGETDEVDEAGADYGSNIDLGAGVDIALKIVPQLEKVEIELAALKVMLDKLAAK